MNAIREKNGVKDVCSFRRKLAIQARDALQDTWSKANERTAVLAILMRHAVDLEWIDRNPVTNIEKLTGGEYEPWPEPKLRAFESACDPHGTARVVYELAIGTGQRLGDCIAMKWDDFDGEYVKVVQEKSGANIQVHCPSRLQDFLKSEPKNGQYILAKILTQHIGKRQVQKCVEEVRETIGVMSGESRLVPQGWRDTAATQRADAGVGLSDIQSVTGHKTRSMVQKHTARASQKAASKRAQMTRGQNKAKRECANRLPNPVKARVESPTRNQLLSRKIKVVRVEGLEPPRLAAPEPKSGASTNFATPAWRSA
ncbi:Integrase [Celeribacter neptunius]|uniref:Integrase n=1 Tax=Celeribacter neptunius TaxID=588602 RepID=A0A1I3JWZ2_9RHOB|nr:Integrase [Celeribacter neptunius]